jgi:hypothetical protein
MIVSFRTNHGETTIFAPPEMTRGAMLAARLVTIVGIHWAM